MTDLLKKFESSPVRYALLLIAFTTLIRFVFVATGQLNLVQDESQYWDWTRHLQLAYYSKGPLIAWIIKTGTLVFGNTELGVRIGSIVGSMLAQLVLFFGIAKLFRRPALALLVLFVFNTMPLFQALGILMTTDNSFVLCWAGAIFSLYAASLPPSEKQERGISSILPFACLSIFFGIGILAKYTMLAFIGVAGLFWLCMLYKGLSWRGFFPRLFVAFAVGLIIGFLPTFIWNFQNDFVGYKHVIYLIGVKGKHSAQFIRFDRFPDYFGSQVGLATPWWLIFSLLGAGSIIKAVFAKGKHLLGFTQRQGLLLVCAFLPLWSFFILWSFHAKVLPNWSTVTYVTASIIAAASFARYYKDRSAKLWGWRNLWPTLAVLFFVLVHVSPIIPLPDDLNPTHRLKGWNDLGQKVDTIKNTEFENPDKVFVFSEIYDMTAALAFYVPGQPRTYCAWVDGRRMNQYDIWPGPVDKVGFDAIYVQKHFYPAIDTEIAKMFDRVEGPLHYQTTFEGHPARKFSIYRCYGYNGYWPDKKTGEY
ncbi:MAG: ArnT family glycosyltransferase [Desulfovibrio sp.]